MGAVACFTALDSSLKALATEYPLGLLVFLRNIVQVIALGALAPLLGAGTLRTCRYGLHFVRGVCLVAGTALLTLSLGRLTMTQSYALTFSAPLIAALMALAFLGERQSVHQWVAIMAGFGGVVLAIGPSGEISLAVLLPIAVASANALMHVLTQRAGKSENAVSMSFWAATAAAGVSAFSLPMAYTPMSALALAWMAAAGLAGTAGQLMMAAAFRRAPTAVVSPFVYTQIGWAMAIGWFAFGEAPPFTAIAGGLIVAASAIAIVRFARV
jgi:drug/metabolite transporter (DMT)-like permease